MVDPLTGARSGMKRSPMTRISLEVMVGRGAAAFTASLFFGCVWRASSGGRESYVGDIPGLQVLGLAFCATDFSRSKGTNYRVIAGCFSITAVRGQPLLVVARL